MRIKVIFPVSSSSLIEPQATFRQRVAASDTIVEVVSLPKGPPSIENEEDVLEAAPYVLAEVKKAEKEGFNAVTIDCTLDVGLRAAKEAVSIPVVGAGEAALSVATILGERFGWILPNPDGISATLSRIAQKGYWPRMASIHSMNLHVLDLRKKDVVLEQLIKTCRKAIDDGANVIVLGCTAMGYLSADLADAIKVPVVDAGAATIKIAEAAVRCAVQPSQ